MDSEKPGLTELVSALQPSFSGFMSRDIFKSPEEREEYLASLDSDTRDYVLKHTDEFSSKADISACINRLHGGS